MKTLVLILRVIAAILLAFLWIVSIPIYYQPFGGCETLGYLTLELGCSDWPQFSKGFGFVLIAAVIAPSKARLHYVAFAVIGLVTLAGGFEGLRAGLLYDINSLDDILAMVIWASPLAIGGLVALVFFLGGNLIINKHTTNSAT